MANIRTHAAVGAAVGVGTYLLGCWGLKKQVTLGGVFLSSLGGIAAGCLPDALEPPLHPNHRSHFHSFAAFLAVAYGSHKAFRNGDLSSDQKLAMLVLSAAYLSHLILDTVTPKSLPLA